MENPVSALVDPSRFPGRARDAYVESFRTRTMDHQFHYDTEKQAQQWLAIHESYSPARTDADCQETYARAFGECARVVGEGATLISIGCGGGQKDQALLACLPGAHSYVPADVSLTLALTAHFHCGMGGRSHPVVVDFARCERFDGWLPQSEKRIFAFFGMLPNFEPEVALGRLSQAMSKGEYLVVSANLAPGGDYRAGVERVLPLYDNGATRRWLATVLIDAGLAVTPEELEFQVVEVNGLLRIEAGYRFRAEQRLRLDGEDFVYKSGDWFRLFYSYRHTPALLSERFAKHRFDIMQEWSTRSGEEGLFLCRKRAT